MSGFFQQDIREVLSDILAHGAGWAHIGELVEELDAREAWGDFEERALLEAKKALVRRLIRQQKDEDGHRRVASIEVPAASGETERIYKQETLFVLEDYKQICAYHMAKQHHHLQEARGYASRCEIRYGVNPLSIP